MPSRAIVWFRRDLRVHDNPSLTQAHREFDEIACVFVLDRRLILGEYPSPARTKSSPLRSRSASRSSRRLSSRNHARLADGKRPASSSRGSSTNSGMTRSASRWAAVRAG